MTSQRNFKSSCRRLILLVGNPHKLSGISSVSGGNQTKGMFDLTHWKRPYCLEGLRAGGEGDDRKLDGWMASLTQWA